MLDYPAALALTLAPTFDWGEETVPLATATGRVLRQTVTADRDQPPFDRVAMDGVAIAYAAYAAGQRRFPVSHMAPAGTAPRPLAATDQCVEVMTGAPLPPGTTTVIRYEDVRQDGEAFVLPDGIADATSIHRRGTDARAGDRMLDDRRVIGPAEMAVLATYGVAEVTVSRWPRVAIASTGDEVVSVDRDPLPHQIRSSNVHQLAALFRAVGIEPTLGHLGDDPAGGRADLVELVRDHDVVLLSGGVSKGKLDHVPDWLAAAGIEKLFHRVAQRPGKPLWVGRDAATMVFALPGNPASSLVGAVAYVGAWLRKQLGISRPDRSVRLLEAVDFPPELTLFRSVRLDQTTEGEGARPVSNNGSGDLVNLAASDGFLVLPADRANFLPGHYFPYLPLRFF
ncbi:molybdopterin molybdochelatase [Neolewinella xylanilytica]|uniref:Molybdopterin molybdenumtransferase n=1 Tax=Neolewinella xylanilytica TaxID=1514080 RepID=A0A2S6IA62_9BACT|nr:molybdopterin molybdotransferase MoeA [Neolewinella xylanilytica]PPK88385.1 molybdopterin molybdochelatase [Neolewinella xylanilytica]